MIDRDALWERIREGDRRAARELIEDLIAAGDEDDVQTAVRAIGRHFDRQAQQLLRRARGATGEAKRQLVDEALEALLTASVAARLPQLLDAGLAQTATGGLPTPPVLPPATNLKAVGVPGGIDLTWVPVPSTAVLPVIGQVVKVYRASQPVLESDVLAPLATVYQARGLENGTSYVLVVETLTATLVSTANLTGTAGAIVATLPAPTGLAATPGNRSLQFTWSDPVLPAGSTITRYALTLTAEELSRRSELPVPSGSGPSRSFTAGDLQNGVPYTLAVQTIGTVDGAADQLGQTASVVAVPGLSGQPFVPRIPILPPDPLLFLDPALAAEVAMAEKFRTEAVAIAQKWRFEYLRQRAAATAQEALAYDRQIVDLMAMALQKGIGAQTQLTPVILSVIDALQGDRQKVLDVAKAIPVVEATATLSDVITSAVLMTAIVEWLARTDTLEVWLGMFDALISDVASFDTSLTHVKHFFDAQYDSGPFGVAVKELAALQLARVGPLVQQGIAPLRTSLGQIIGATSEKMGDVFAAFDLPLLMTNGGKALVPNVDPLSKDLGELAESVAVQETVLAAQIRSRLLDVIEGRARALFRSFMIAYFVTPIAAALVVSIAGGPVAAAALAAAIAIGVEALLHLFARWLLGPLQDQLDGLEEDVAAAFRELQRAIAAQVQLTALVNPQSRLRLLEDELRELQTLLPRAFLDDLAALLAQARSLTLSSGVLHALAAERALGYEQATAFDRIQSRYRSTFTPATQLPGGTDTGLFSAAAILRDLRLLEQDLIRLTDGRELRLTRRLSLFRLLGGIGDPLTATGLALGRFADFLRTGRAAIELVPEMILDTSSPGVYRALIDGVRVVGLARASAFNTPAGFPGLSVTISHGGSSSIRIRRDANPSAPPVALPDGLPDEESYVLAVTYRDVTVPFMPNTIEAAVWSVVANMSAALNWDNIRNACIEQLPAAVAELGNVIAVDPLGATGSSALASHPPVHGIDGDRATYFSSADQTSATVPAWFTVDLGASIDTIIGVRFWPRPAFRGWPAEWTVQVSGTGQERDFRPVKAPVVKRVETVGADAVYVQFAPSSGRYVRLYATTLTHGDGSAFNLQVADVQVTTMHATSRPALFTAINGSSTIEGHPWTNLIDGNVQTWASSATYTQARPPVESRPFFLAEFPRSEIVNRIRIWPRQDRPEDFPKELEIQLRGTATYPFTAREAGTGVDPYDYYLPTYRIAAVGVTGIELAPDPEDPIFYSFQAAAIEAIGFHPNPPILPTQYIRETVETLIRQMPWPPPGTSEPVNAALQIGAVLRDGLGAQALAGLADAAAPPRQGAARAAYRAARNELLGHVAKWAGARWQDESDPNVRGLGYVQLMQSIAPSAATFELFPADDGVTRPGVLLVADETDGPAGLYAPLENLGLGGVLQILAPDAAASLLADLLVDIRVRACYDPQLAATVQAGQQQREQQFGRMADLGATVGRVLSVGGPLVNVALTDPRTAQFSFRTQRDRILQAATTGAEVQTGSLHPTGSITIDGVTFTPSQATPLPLSAPFSFFSDSTAAVPDSLALVFTRETTQTLQMQLGQIVVTPAVLGVDPALLDVTPLEAARPMLTGLSVALVPTRSGTAAFTPKTGPVDALLQPLLPPEWSSPGHRIRHLVSLTTRAQAAAHAVPLADLFPATGSRVVTVDLRDLVPTGRLYEVFFSATFNAPLVGGVTT